MLIQTRYFLNRTLCLLILMGCTKNPLTNLANSEIGDDHLSSITNLDPIRSISLIAPATQPSLLATPKVRISPVKSGDTVQLFANATCTQHLVDGTATDTSIELTSTVLPVGIHKLYARRARSNKFSPCSTVYLDYQVLPSITGPTIAIAAPSSSTWVDGNPSTITFDVDYTSFSAITLSVPDISIQTVGVTASVASVTALDVDTYQVTIDTISGSGTFTISIAAGSATDGTLLAPAAGPSLAVTTTDNAPLAPTTVALDAGALNIASPDLNLSWVDTNTTTADFAEYQIAYSISNVTEPASNTYVSVAGLDSEVISAAPADCDDYYIWVRAMDLGGHPSAGVVSATAFYEDTVPPTFTGTPTLSTNDGNNIKARTVDWSSMTISDNCTDTDDLDLDIAIGTTAGGEQKIPFTSLKTAIAIDLTVDSSYQIANGVDSFTLALNSETNYYTSLVVRDGEGNESAVRTTSAWQTLAVPYWVTSATLSLWLDAADTSTLWQDATCTGTNSTTSAHSIQCWEDKSGLGHDATMATAGYASRVNTAVHARTMLQMDGVDDYFDDNYTYVARTAFVFFRMDSTLQASSDLGQIWGSYAEGIHIAPDGRDVGFTSFDGATGGGSVSGSYSLNGGTFTATSAGSKSPPWVYNNFELMSVVFSVNKTVNRQMIGSLIPNFAVGVHQLGAQLGDIIIYGNTLSTNETELLQGYLACKWDRRNQLPVSHPYYHVSATNNSGCP